MLLLWYGECIDKWLFCGTAFGYTHCCSLAGLDPFYGDACQYKKTDDPSDCYGSTCQNGGSCNYAHTFSGHCSCPLGFHGEFCEYVNGESCWGEQCLNGSDCCPSCIFTATDGSLKTGGCICLPGYYGKLCEVKATFSDPQCHQNTTCLNGGFVSYWLLLVIFMHKWCIKSLL